VSNSILDSTKKVLGIGPTDPSFDDDVILFVNGVFFTLNQLGIGPDAGFMIVDNTATWDAFIGTDPRLNSVKTYVYLRVRMLFDPPSTSFVIDAMEKQIHELEWRLNTKREGESWTDPNPPSTPPPASMPWWDSWDVTY
jgi:hypothetical protein